MVLCSDFSVRGGPYSVEHVFDIETTSTGT